MMRVLLCVGQEHDLRLVWLAVLICFVGAAAIAKLFSRLQAAKGRGQIIWVALTAIATGDTVWSTHFVAMLAFRTPSAVQLDTGLTIVSFLIEVLLSAPGLALAATRRWRWAPAAGGAVIGLAITTMHYVGMAAYRIEGVVTWDPGYVVASAILASGLGAIAFTLLCRATTRLSRGGGAIVFALAVAALHFTGMAAMTIAPLYVSGGAPGLAGATMSVMALVTAFGGALVLGFLMITLLIDDQNQSEAFCRLSHMALHDGLTDLHNRASFQRIFTDRLADLHGEGGQLAVVMLDLARFKQVNDIHGHHAGDQLLIALADRLAAVLRPDETLARLGGDEFTALKPFRERADFDDFIARMIGAMAEPFCFERFTTSCRASFGVAFAPEHGNSAEQLLANADLAMYRSKAKRSIAPVFYTAAMGEAVRHRLELGNQLRLGLDTQQLHLVYQVQVALGNGRVVGYEALARWQHPVLGPVSPQVFIPLVEEMGEIWRFGEWALRAACREAVAWPEPHLVAVNLSPLQLADPLLVDKVRDALLDSGLPPARLELELTESAIVQDREHAQEKMRQIKQLGVKIALDDFGTGFSSIDILRSFPFDRLKLDASFATDIEHDQQAVAIMRSVAALGQTLGMAVLAEGIETPAQMAIARREGCHFAQGYLLGKPARKLRGSMPGERLLLPAPKSSAEVHRIAR